MKKRPRQFTLAIIMALGLGVDRKAVCQSRPFSATGESTTRFAVASIKPTTIDRPLNGVPNGRPVNQPLRYSVVDFTLKLLILDGYTVQPYQVLGGPDWIDRDRFDVDARSELPSTWEEKMVMLRGLLDERFSLRVHKETRKMSALLLTISKTGHRLKEIRESELDGWSRGPSGMIVWRGTVKQLADLLSFKLLSTAWDGGSNLPSGGLPVVDRTGLGGLYAFSIAAGKPGPDWITDLASALHRDCGLDLRKGVAETPVIIVDSASKPTHN